MKRILILNYEFPPLGGGGGVVAKMMAEKLVHEGYEVDFVTTWFKGQKTFEIVDGIHVYRVKVIGRRKLSTATHISMITYNFSAFWKGLSLCRKNTYESMHTHFVLPTGPVGYVLSKLFGIRNLVSLHGGDIYDPTRRLSPHKNIVLRTLVRFLLNKADSITTYSSDVRKKCIEIYNPNKNVNVTPLPYEPTFFNKVQRSELNLEENKKYVISVGRLIKRKGFDDFVKTISLLPEDIEGIIVGDGPELLSLKRLANTLGVVHRIHFVGELFGERKFQYLSNSDVFLLCSTYEALGIVLKEAIQVGLPIVSTNNGGQSDLVREGENGFLVNVGDTVAMADRICLLTKTCKPISQSSR